MCKFRDLTADEIECRVATVSQKGCSLLLYKDARCDMNILDETVGSKNWQRKHTRDNANCIVSIWDEDKKQWIEKEDTGTESYTEKEKGQASDSFKRACFNWGIGRELYTAPFIWVGSDKCAIQQKSNGSGYTTNDKFAVSDIEVVDKRITKLSIVNAKTGEVCYTWTKGKTAKAKATSTSRSTKASSTPKTAANTITEESCKALNTVIARLNKSKGYATKDILASLAKPENVGKPHTEYTEDDAQKALTILNTWAA